MTKVVSKSLLLGSICVAAIVAGGIAEAQEVKPALGRDGRDRGDHAGLAAAARQRGA